MAGLVGEVTVASGGRQSHARRVLLQCDDGGLDCGPAAAPDSVLAVPPVAGPTESPTQAPPGELPVQESTPYIVIAIVVAAGLALIVVMFLACRSRRVSPLGNPVTRRRDCDCPVASGRLEDCLLCPQCGEAFTSKDTDVEQGLGSLMDSMSGVDRRPRLRPCGCSICATCALEVETAAPWKDLPLNHQAVAMLAIALGPAEERDAHVEAMRQVKPVKAGQIVYGPSAADVGGPLRCPYCLHVLLSDPPMSWHDGRAAAFPCGHGGCVRCVTEFQGECVHGCNLAKDCPGVINQLALQLLRLLQSREIKYGKVQRGLYSMQSARWTRARPATDGEIVTDDEELDGI